MRVEVARIMPSKVKKLRSLLCRRESKAIRAASQNDALGRNVRFAGTAELERRYFGMVCSVCRQRSHRPLEPVENEVVQPEARTLA